MHFQNLLSGETSVIVMVKTVIFMINKVTVTCWSNIVILRKNTDINRTNTVIFTTNTH